MNRLTMGLLTFLATGLNACGSGSSKEGTFDKSQMGTKFDANIESKVCAEHNQPPTCDVCKAAGWYNDGTCDSFCQQADPDCQPPDCQTLEDLLFDECVPDDDEPLNWQACLIYSEWGNLVEYAFGCCEEDTNHAWCAEIVPTEDMCDKYEGDYFECIDNNNDPETCVPSKNAGLEYEKHVRCCGQYSYAFCEYLPAVAKVTVDKLEVPVLALRDIAGTLGYMKVTVERGNAFSDAVLQATLREGKAVFGEECDGVPALGAAFDEDPSVAVFIKSLRKATDWSGSLTGDQIDALEDWLLQDSNRWRIFYGDASGQACGGEGTVSYNLIWNTASNNVIYLILYPYSE